MSFLGDMRVLYSLAFASKRGKTHAERLEKFYGAQAGDYDDFRRRLLKGRRELFRSIPVPKGGTWIDMGGGTGSNLENLGGRIKSLKSATVVDLSPSLLSVAQRRFKDHGWRNVYAVEADATTYQPPEPVDVVTFSYSLTMIPDWFAAIDHARTMLKPGGTIGVVDFYVARKHPSENRKRHPYAARVFWPAWFSIDNVFPSPDHLPYLQRRFECASVSEHRGKIPYLFGLKAPYYQFLGKKVQ